MNYFVAYALEGDARQWHIETAEGIYEKFHNCKIHDKIPPHVTIMSPFVAKDVSSLKKILRQWTSEFSLTESFHMNGFGQFHNKVVFAETVPSTLLKESVPPLQQLIEQTVPSAKNPYPQWNPHATLANYLTSEEFENIWNYLQTLPRPDFSLPFTNVTLFRATEEGGWEAEERFPIS